MRSVTVILCVLVILMFLPCGELVVGAEGEELVTALRVGELEENVYEVVFEAVADVGICGLLCAISYDEDRLVLLSAGAECGVLEFSFADVGGEVRFLTDGVENVEKITVSLFFGFIDGRYGEAEVLLDSVEVYGLVGGDLIGLEAEVSNRGVLIGDADEADTECSSLPSLTAYDLVVSERESILSVLGSVGVGYFAAGVEMFIVHSDGSGERMMAVGTLPISEVGVFNLSVDVGREVCAVVITPVVFDRNGCIRGEKLVVVG